MSEKIETNFLQHMASETVYPIGLLGSLTLTPVSRCPSEGPAGAV